MERPGIVDLRDLLGRYMWDARAIAPFIAAAELHVEPRPAWRGVAPPRELVVIAASVRAAQRGPMQPWLAACEHLVIVRDGRGDAPIEDPELRSLIEEEWQQEWQAVLAELPHAAVFDWRDERDPAPCRAAIEHALARAAELPAAVPDPAPANPDLELPMSTWLPWSGGSAPPNSAHLGDRLAMRSGRPVLLDASGGEIDLAAPHAPIVLDASKYPPAPAERHGPHRARIAYGRDPIHPVAWRGHRMALYWRYIGAREIGFLSATDHDWPCGPAKKVWSYSDNYPVGAALAPDADACIQTFEHDALFLTDVPVGWHRAGAVDVAAFAGDPRRAVLYAQSEEFHGRQSDDLLEEDNRELAPVVVLGPSAAVRYAVDLRHRVVRVRGPHEGASAEILGGPDEGFAVFDDEHRLVRRGSGLLLGGWFRFATIEDGGSLWREDLATGERTLLGSADRVVCVDPEVEAVVLDALREGRHDAVAALRASHETREITGDLEVVAIPGTRNIIELARDALRVV